MTVRIFCLTDRFSVTAAKQSKHFTINICEKPHSQHVFNTCLHFLFFIRSKHSPVTESLKFFQKFFQKVMGQMWLDQSLLQRFNTFNLFPFQSWIFNICFDFESIHFWGVGRVKNSSTHLEIYIYTYVYTLYIYMHIVLGSFTHISNLTYNITQYNF